MVLAIDSNAVYLVMPNAKSRITRYFQLNHHPECIQYSNVNGTILIECKALRHIVSLAAEAETAGVFHNAQIAILNQYMLE